MGWAPGPAHLAALTLSLSGTARGAGGRERGRKRGGGADVGGDVPMAGAEIEVEPGRRGGRAGGQVVELDRRGRLELAADLGGQGRQGAVVAAEEVRAEVVGAAVDLDAGALAADRALALEERDAVAGGLELAGDRQAS